MCFSVSCLENLLSNPILCFIATGSCVRPKICKVLSDSFCRLCPLLGSPQSHLPSHSVLNPPTCIHLSPLWSPFLSFTWLLHFWHSSTNTPTLPLLNMSKASQSGLSNSILQSLILCSTCADLALIHSSVLPIGWGFLFVLFCVFIPVNCSLTEHGGTSTKSTKNCPGWGKLRIIIFL